MRQLNSEQARAVKHFNGPVLVLAGPGSGKTFTLVERIRYLIEVRGVNPSKILTITFSKKASVEMKTRFYDLIGDKFYPVTFGTFHSIFYNILKTYHNYTPDSIMTPNDKIKYMKKTLKKLSVENAGADDVCFDMLSKVSAYKSVYFTDIDKENEFVEICKEYERLCRTNGKIDFDDMIVDCLKLLKENKEAHKKWQGVFKYFLVDEFQDINDIQYETLMLLAGDEKNIFAVGDDDQSIYGFRGSKPELMKRFLKLDGCKVIDMYKNYRCAEDVIIAAGCLVSNNKERIVKNQISCKDDKSGNVYTCSFASEKEESDFVIDKLKELMDDNKEIKDTAILYRTEQCVTYMEERLKLSGIAYLRAVKTGGFYDNDWVKDIISYLKIAADVHEISDVYRIINKPDRDISREDIRNLDIADKTDRNISSEDIKNIEEADNHDYNPATEDIHSLLTEIRSLRDMTCFAAVNYILKGLGYYKYLLKENVKHGHGKDKTDEMTEELFMRAKNFYSIKQWLEYIEDFTEEKDADKQIDKQPSNSGSKTNIPPNPNQHDSNNTLILQTAHSSKGLEYENVFIIGLTEGLFPHHKAKTDSEIEEERRLMYVAMTRAKKNLYILGRGETKHGKRVSRFVDEIKTCGKTEDIKV